ncbi:formate dehydrogenase accessory sulfurtransferase FdhD [Sanyastnella coralliicola]|uniref:formate dehydrogenase accessory sulfurtransferase FdhD n=1 Tax=Sanyastnella coralliicola TaxID=3069118 RepID=UPI0027B8DF60|nr:formate dehydrogenase accessory sulfurtransferase FdhD [Longitalea sp. SCSIO 12813]
MNHQAYEGELNRNGDTQPTKDELVVERPLQVVINGEALTVTMQTPGHEAELVRGLLHNEDIYRGEGLDRKAFQFRASEENIMDQITLDIDSEKLGQGYLNSRQLLSVSSCGICGRTSFEGRSGSIDSTENSIDLEKAFGAMRKEQHLFSATGGSHGAAAFTDEGDHLVTREDIGRHNAVDKVIGHLLFEGNLSNAKVLLVSGRISYEIVSKCFMAGIPNLAAVSAPSSLAVDFAKELGIQLYGFVRDSRATRYA